MTHRMEIWRSSDKDWIGFAIIFTLALSAGAVIIGLFVFKLRSIALKEKLKKEREKDREEELISKWRSRTLERKKNAIVRTKETAEGQVKVNPNGNSVSYFLSKLIWQKFNVIRLSFYFICQSYCGYFSQGNFLLF